MTDKTDEPGKSAQKPAGDNLGPKKPSAILDLKAKEVASEPQKPAPQSGAKSGASATSTASTTASAASSADAKPTAQSLGTASRPGPSVTASAVGATQRPASPSKPAEQKPGSLTEPPKVAGTVPPSRAKGPAVASSFSPGSVLTHAFAGLVGGFLALLAADTLGPRLGLQQPAQNLIASDFNRRLEATEQAVKARATDPATTELQQKLAGIEQRLTQLDDVGARVNQLADAQSKLAGDAQSMEQRLQQPEVVKELGDRVARLDQALAALRAAGANDPQAGRIPQLAAITGKLNDLESALSTQIAAIRKGVTQEIDQRLAEVAETSEATKSGTQRLDRELAGLKSEAARLAARADALKTADDATQQALRTIQEDAGALKGALDSLKADTTAQFKSVTRPQDVATALAPLTSQVTALEQTVQSVAKSEEDRKATAGRIVLALELGNLKRAIDRGSTYAAELANVKKVAGGQIDLGVLERYKDNGLATQPELAREFRSVANAVIDADAAPSDSSMIDRLMQGAKSIVRVRRTDHRPEDTGAEATVGRMEKALNAGNLDEVLNEASRLSPRARDAADKWLTRIEARASVDRAVSKIEDQLKASLSGTSGEKRT